MLIPKLTYTRDKKWRMFVASLPCILCGILGASQAAHIHKRGQKSTSKKVSDNQIAPLCHEGANGCHGKVDRYEIDIDREKLVNRCVVAHGSYKSGNPEAARIIFSRYE